MYPNYINDRKELGYECLKDTLCGNKVVLITDSSVVFVKHVSLNVKDKSKRIIFVSDQDTNRLMKPSKVKINLDIEPKIMMPSLSKSIGSFRTKSDLKNPVWINNYINTLSRIRGGDQELDVKLIRSIFQKMQDYDLDRSKINKLLRKIANASLSKS